MKFASKSIALIHVNQWLVEEMKYVNYKIRKLFANVKKDSFGIQFHLVARNPLFQIAQEIRNVKRLNHVKLMF
jgi:hypothetical protein